MSNSHVTDNTIPSVPLPTVTQDDTPTVVVSPTQDDTPTVVVLPTQDDTPTVVVPPTQDDTPTVVVPPTQDDTPTVVVPPTQDDTLSLHVEGDTEDTKPPVVDKTLPTIDNETKPEDEFKSPTVTAMPPLVGVSLKSDLIQFEERHDRVDELGIAVARNESVAGNESVAVETSNQVQISVVNETPSSPLIRYPRLDSLLEGLREHSYNNASLI